MTRTEFYELWLNAAGKGRKTKTKHLLSACAEVGFMPNYKTPLRPIDAAWFMWVYAATPVTTNVIAAKWIREQVNRLMIGYKSGEVKTIPTVELAHLLNNRSKLKTLQSIGIDQQTGAISALFEDGKTQVLSNYSAIPSGQIQIENGVKELTIYSGDFIRQIADRMAIAALIDKAKVNVNELEALTVKK